MRCIFCLKDSSKSFSKEHIIPESLGNGEHVLPKGIVCDACNNYFAQIEERVLNSHEFVSVRFNQLIKNKKGNVPQNHIFFGSKLAVKARRVGRTEFVMDAHNYKKVRGYLDGKKTGEMRIPISGTPPKDKDMSRFLAKMALEAMAQRLKDVSGGLDYLTDEDQFNPLRNYARCAQKQDIWEYSKRRIYDENNEIINEWSFLRTKKNELYFVVAIFGVEYVINIGGPEMDGYNYWLKENDGASPLYLTDNGNEC